MSTKKMKLSKIVEKSQENDENNFQELKKKIKQIIDDFFEDRSFSFPLFFNIETLKYSAKLEIGCYSVTIEDYYPCSINLPPIGNKRILQALQETLDEYEDDDDDDFRLTINTNSENNGGRITYLYYD